MADLTPLASLATSNPAGAVDLLLPVSKTARAVPYALAALSDLLQIAGDKKTSGELRAKLTEALENVAKVDNVSEPAVRELGVPVCSVRAKESTKWQEKVLALRLLELWSESAPYAVSESMVSLVPLLSELMWDSKTQVKDQAKATLTAACLSIENVDLEPFIPQLILSISQPETVEECVQGLAATTFVQAVRAPALSITVPLLDRGFKERKVACVRQTAKITENLAKLVETPADVAPFMPVLGPALAKAKLDVSDPECRTRCAAAHDALLAIGSYDAQQVEAKQAESAKIKAAAQEIVTKAAGNVPKPVLDFTVEAVTGLIRGQNPIQSAWVEAIEPTLGVADAQAKAADMFKAFQAKGGLGTSSGPAEVLEEASDESGQELLCDCRFSLAYGSKILLNQARMRLHRGRRYGLVGLKAAGKTTLMKAISNNQVEGFPTADKLKTVFIEADVLHAPESVLEFCVQSMAKTDPNTTRAEIEAGLRAVGFDDEHLNKPVWNLSGGWRIKLALARGMIRKADILLMDQPTNHLDKINVKWVQDFIMSDACKNVTFVIVTHNLDFANTVLTNVIYFTPQMKLDSYVGNMEAFFQKIPDARAIFDITKSDSPFVFPPPSPIEGLKNKGSKCLSLEHVTFSYPGQTSPQLIDVTVRVSMASRVCCAGPNGAGKSTLIKILMGALTPQQGVVYRHPNVRVAYVGQHAFEYIQDHLNKTPNQYIRWRYEDGDDKEALNKSNLVLTPEEQKKVEAPWEVIFQDEDGKTIKEKRIVEKIVGRRKNGNKLEYEIKWRSKPQDSNMWFDRDELIERGFEKMVALVDRRKLAAEGAYQRVLTSKAVEDHLVATGLDAEAATHTRMSQLSSGQRIKVVLAAALWYGPQLLVLDEPTNYCSRDDQAALAGAINQWGGGIVLITHSEEFAKLTTREQWLVVNHRCEVAGAEVDWAALEKEAAELGLNYQGEQDQVDAQGNKIERRGTKRIPSDVKPKEKKELMKSLKAKVAAGTELTEFEEACCNEWGLFN